MKNRFLAYKLYEIAILGGDQMNIRYGDDVLVMGAGPMGMILAMLASHSNANHVVVCASSVAKLPDSFLRLPEYKLLRSDSFPINRRCPGKFCIFSPGLFELEIMRKVQCTPGRVIQGR